MEKKPEGEKNELEELKKKFTECEKEKNEYLAGWQRSRADFLNYKKEEMERIAGLLKYADVGLILRILPILDNFDEAQKKLQKEAENDEKVKGFLQMKKQLQDLLESRGVKAIDCLGKKFDPNFQEIVEELEIKDKESGLIIEEVQKGYMMEDRVLRPAKVKVTK